MTYFVDQLKSAISKGGGLARSNLYLVQLPALDTKGIGGLIAPEFNAYDMNILCRSTQLPGRQILTHERHIGHQRSHIAYTYGVEDITLTFHVLNDYKIKKYFEVWQSLAVNNDNYELGYYKEYAKPVTIKQIRKGISIPIYKNDIGFLEDIPSNIRNRLPRIGPIDLSQGQIDLSFITSEMVMYECRLDGAFPTSMASIDLSDNNVNGLTELSVQLSYTNWYNKELESQTGLAGILAKYGIFDIVNNVSGIF